MRLDELPKVTPKRPHVYIAPIIANYLTRSRYALTLYTVKGYLWGSGVAAPSVWCMKNIRDGLKSIRWK